MANKPNVTKLYDKLFAIKEMLSDALQEAMDAANDAEGFGGEISRVLTSQLRQEFIPAIQKYVDDKGTSSSVMALIQFLDSVPLAWVRIGPQEDPNAAVPGAEVINKPDLPVEGGNPSARPTVPTPQSAGEASITANEAPGKLSASAIINRKNGLKEVVRNRWKDDQGEQEIASGKLNFKDLSESYRKQPSPPSLLESGDEDENKVFDRYLEKVSQNTDQFLGEVTQKPESSDKSKTSKRLEEDFVAGPYKIPEKEDIDGWKDWKKLTDSDDDLNAKLRDQYGPESLLRLANSGSSIGGSSSTILKETVREDASKTISISTDDVMDSVIASL
jgi:hypothetical protein